MGVNNISFFLTQKTGEGGEQKESTSRQMKDKDYVTTDMLDDLKKEFAGEIDDISLSRQIGEIKAESGKKYANISLEGLNPASFKQKKIRIIAGRNISGQEQNDGRKVIVVSDRYVSNMFDGDKNEALGKAVEVVINNKYYTYTIVGIYEYVERSGAFSAGTSQKDLRTGAYIPLACAIKQQNKGELYDSFEVIATQGVNQGELATKIQTYFNQKYYENNDAFEIYGYSMKEEVNSLESMLNTQTYAFMAIGAISLLVGGIGVMNIMIVSITERTREIGTRKALGATNGSIRMQFITEAVVVCLMGGIIGIIVGEVFGLVATKIMNYSGSASVGSIIICVIFSMAFGVFFGYYPANKAAKLNPIEALRYE